MFEDFDQADADEFITDIDPLDVFDRMEDEGFMEDDENELEWECEECGDFVPDGYNCSCGDFYDDYGDFAS